MNHKVIIVDFGSQYTQLIARRVREQNIYCEIVPFHTDPATFADAKAVILSGGPCSVNQEDAPGIDLETIVGKVPVLAICYGAQLIARDFGGKVASAASREYGRANVRALKDSPLFEGLDAESQVWMSHGDTIINLPTDYELIGSTESVEVAAYQHPSLPVYCLQFHPEVTHSTQGAQILHNFLIKIASIPASWTPAAFVEQTVAELQAELGNERVICGLSGGVDSTVAASLIHRAIGDRLYCIFVDNGILRKDEFTQVLKHYEQLGLNVIGVDARDRFLGELAGVSDPEQKRKIIGRVFIEVFQDEANKLDGISYLAQGTIYPDVIESV
ncbi:MAG: glutamine-hydrolyzing GMP synthase, partial [Bacteroidota bacterium]